MATSNAVKPFRSRKRWSPSPAVSALLPLSIIIGCFFVLPILGMAVTSFITGDTRSGVQFSFANFAQLPEDHHLALRNSALVSGIGSLIGAVIGGITSFCISRIRSAKLDSVTAVLSSVLANDGGAPLAFSFIVTLGNTGVVFSLLGLESTGFSLYSWQGLIVMYQTFLIPTMVMVTLPTFVAMRKAWKEANTSLGGSPWTFWWRVGLPVALPSLVGGWILLFGAAYATHASAAVLIGSGSFQLIPLNIASTLSSGTGPDGQGAAMALGVSMVIIAIITLFIFSRMQRRSARWLG